MLGDASSTGCIWAELFQAPSCLLSKWGEAISAVYLSSPCTSDPFFKVQWKLSILAAPWDRGMLWSGGTGGTLHGERPGSCARGCPWRAVQQLPEKTKVFSTFLFWSGFWEVCFCFVLAVVMGCFFFFFQPSFVQILGLLVNRSWSLRMMGRD